MSWVWVLHVLCRTGQLWSQHSPVGIYKGDEPTSDVIDGRFIRGFYVP